ncbi:MAG: hypothetical protein ACK2VA_02760 [Anaerolineae bacterium]|jgi:hypothetical protein
MLPIEALSRLTPQQVHDRVAGYARRYVVDWDEWLATPVEDRIPVFGRIMRKWQATRPYVMRRPRAEAEHDPPYLEDLIAEAQPHLDLVGDLTVRTLVNVEPLQQSALRELWLLFRRLSLDRPASCVGISKAVLLLTDGRIGPSLDSRVRAGLEIEHVTSAAEWVEVLVGVSLDIRAFERTNGISLREAVPQAFRHLGEGRLCDMAFGPRERRR